MLPTSNPDFWRMLEGMIESCEIIIDRPKGSHHPRFDEIIYPLDYGYLAGTKSMDGEGIDLWLGSDPARRLTAVFITVDPEKMDSEIKLMVGCTEDEISTINHFFNDYASMKALLILREEDK